MNPSLRTEVHPIGVTVREDGCVFIPKSRSRAEHWTYGSLTAEGYKAIKFKGRSYKVHRLVAECFIPNPEHKPQIDHINRDRSDNRVGNLRWVTQSENLRNTKANDRVDQRQGTHKYDDEKEYRREYQCRWRIANPDKYVANYKRHYQKHRVEILAAKSQKVEV